MDRLQKMCNLKIDIIVILYMDNIYEQINNFYNRKGFLDKYGGDLYTTIFIVLFFIIVFSYFYVFNNIEKLKANWETKRCSPEVIPFAGYVNAPEGTSKFKYTADNFTGCVNNIFKKLGNESLQPIYYIMAAFGKLLNELKSSIENIRATIDRTRNYISDAFSSVFNTANSITLIFVKLIIVIKDTFGKIKGILTTMVYSLFGSYLAFGSFIGTIYNFLILVLVGIGILMVVFWATFQFGLAAIMTGIFGTLIPMVVLTSKILKDTMKVKGVKKVPKKPRCFDENVKIKLINGDEKCISDIKIGEILVDGSLVTATMKLSSEGEKMYQIGNIIVSGDHHILNGVNEWIKVNEHPSSILLDHYDNKYLYCIGTDSKKLEIDDIIFADWDEVGDDEMRDIKMNAKYMLPDNFKLNDMHKYIDGGFVGSTEIELEDGTTKQIKDIHVDERLRFGIKVLGVVKIDATGLNGVYEYYLEDKLIKGANLLLYNENIGEIDTSKLTGNKVDNVDYIYNLVTDKTIYYTNGLYACDYNSCMDKFVNKTKNDIIINY